MDSRRWLQLLTCNVPQGLVGDGRGTAPKNLFMYWSPPIQISALYLTSSSHQHHILPPSFGFCAAAFCAA